MIVQDQTDIIAFLCQPAAFGPGVSGVERIDTHISIIFLVGERVFKLKRAVKFPYLDFSTAEKRRQACEAEVRINRRTAPEIYLGIVAVTKGPGGELCLLSQGEELQDEALDWLVEMKRFDQDGLFDRLAQKNILDKPHMEDLAAVIAQFHESAEICTQGGGQKLIEDIIDNNDACFAELGKDIFDMKAIQNLTKSSKAYSLRIGDVLDARLKQGRVRHCHGDLHLRNIVMIDDKPVLFDAIEFSRELAEIDVLYDLAFLLMDLVHRQLRPLANVALNRYLDLMDDTAGIGCLPLFISVRAAVRAHVSAVVAKAQTSNEQAVSLIAEAQSYLSTAQDSLSPSAPALVAVGGLSGSGKSRLAQELAPALGAVPGARIARSDVLRKRLAGVSIHEKLNAEGYTDDMTQKTYERVYQDCAAALDAGQWAIADAVFAQPEQRMAIEQLARKFNIPFYGLWLDAPENTLISRVAARHHDASDADQKIVEQQTKYNLGEITWRRIDSAQSMTQTMEAAQSALSS